MRYCIKTGNVTNQISKIYKNLRKCTLHFIFYIKWNFNGIGDTQKILLNLIWIH